MLFKQLINLVTLNSLPKNKKETDMAKKQSPRVTENINIANARIGFRNFSGKEGQYNPQGNRNFVVFLDDINVAKALEEEGWNIRWLDPRDPAEEAQPILSIRVQYSYYPPKIILVNSEGKQTNLREEDVSILDWADIERVDVTVRPYNYNVHGKDGVKAYLKTMYVTLQEDPWEKKYINPPDSAQAAVCAPGYEYRDGACRLIIEE
jgi:hypothetical protein